MPIIGGLQGWHPGERSIQSKLDYSGTMSMAWTWISEDMPEQHRVFYNRNLPFLPLTTLDAEGRPWGSIIAGKQGKPGFIRSPMETTLDIDLRTWVGDPWEENVEAWKAEGGKRADPRFLVAGIGVELSTRRRNKLAGWATNIRQVGEDTNDYNVRLRVNEAIGNCPKYINVRELVPHTDTHPEVAYKNLHMGDNERLPDELIAFILDADAVFFSTSYEAKPEDAARFPSHVGMNQRAGRPGFVRVRPSDGRTLVLPDYSGNRLMTSLGNIEVTPFAGITIIDYLTGSILYLTGNARTLVGSEALSLMPRQRVLTAITTTGYIFVRDALPSRQRAGTEPERSPYSPPIKLLREEMENSGQHFDDGAVNVLLSKVDILSPTLAVFKWEVEGSGKDLTIEPGQAAILDFSDFIGKPAYQHMAPAAPTSVNDDRIRTWTISDAPAPGKGTRTFELTMRLKPGGAVTGALFTIANKLAEIRPEVLADMRPMEARVQLVGISGSFVLPPPVEGKEERLLWIAGGIGITPYLSMLSALVQAKRRADILLVLSTREPAVLISLVRQALGSGLPEGSKVRLAVFTKGGSVPEVPGGVDASFHHGRVTDVFWETLELDDLHSRKAYVCGPKAFEEGVLSGLKARGLDTSSVTRENFEY
ncbi:hypothetical protein DENSPDRAFT_860449 [Dentipellis sp. KUC8613]|nr:hypothetical protein DENSPDRAFT_860449 [Dentipellis sp. KUC8613]